MAQFPALPLWTDAYLADTGHLTTLEHGAYLMLLMSMWRAGGELPNDDRKLARLAKLTMPQWQRIRGTVMEFMTVSSNGLVSQRRLLDELQYVRDHSKKQAKNSRQRWENRTATPGPVGQHPRHPSDGSEANPLKAFISSDAVAMPNASQTDAPTPTPTPIIEEPNGSLSGTTVPDRPKQSSKKAYPPEFEKAWLAYPRTPNMSKFEALPQWRKLSQDEQAMVIKSIPKFIAHLRSKPNLEVLHFCRYLSWRRFEGFARVGEESAPDWPKRLTYARTKKFWSIAEWGPMPGTADCQVPTELLEPEDGVGWSEQQRAA